MTRPPRNDPNAVRPPGRRMRGFEPASGLVAARIQKAGEKRGFAVSRLLTHWPEIAGPELAAISQPVKVGYGREGFGATLTLLVSPAHAPIVQMALPRLRERVNGVYGYNAIARIALTQTAATGFAEGQSPFGPRSDSAAAPQGKAEPAAARQAEARATGMTEGIHDTGLRRALELLARNVLTRRADRKPPETDSGAGD